MQVGQVISKLSLMWWLNKILFVLIFIPGFVWAQNCNSNLKGYIFDTGTGKPLEAVAVFVKETNTYYSTDSKGIFISNGLCPGHYHFILSHIGCAPKMLHVSVISDTVLNIEMDHSVHLMHSVTVKGHHNQSNHKEEHIHESEIIDQAKETLAELLESLNGVSLIKNGGAAKPIVHGMYGNRLSILNNGIPQAGQQWGNDHAPEIDPLTANQITVIKGSGTLEHFGGNMGSIILVEPQKIKQEPHIHGKSTYFFESNGRGHGLHAKVQQHTRAIGWRLGVTAKKRGDQNSANYFLNNTGSDELNYFAQLQNVYKHKWYNSLYFSAFNSTIGVLRGGHIGNLTDLQDAFSREVPFFTEPNFSYGIEAPKQRVNHYLTKLRTKRLIDSLSSFTLTAAFQLNQRNEFDVRRVGRSEIPAMSLRQYSFYNDLKYKRRWRENQIKFGIQLNILDNTNLPGTGILPLIPDYLSYQSASYFIVNKTHGKHLLEAGLRYDYMYRSVIVFNKDRTIDKYLELFGNYSASALWKYNASDKSLISAGFAYAMRPPGANELYSFGLHQGVSGIEQGDINLDPESSFKGTFSWEQRFFESFYLSSFFYAQPFSNYIYLQPQEEIRLTIRGAFPVFKYQQIRALIYGSDWVTGFDPFDGANVECKYSYIQGLDQTNDLGLVFIPANRWQGSLNYELASALHLGQFTFKNLRLQLNGTYVTKKDNILFQQDFLLPPGAYYLLGAKFTTDIELGGNLWRIVLDGDNLLNTAYRDYLNRLRYFSDDLGRNISLGIIFEF